MSNITPSDAVKGDPIGGKDGYILYQGHLTSAPALDKEKEVLGQRESADPALSVHRFHDIEEDPPVGKIWRYTPRDLARLAADVKRASNNRSFVSRILRVITHNGGSKNFEEITGEDGLTFGVTDFAGTGCYSFFKDAERNYPADFAKIFGKSAVDLLNESWVNQHNPKKDNGGLVRFRFVREGLARFLGQRRLHGFQLAHFMTGKVRPSLVAFHEHQFRYQLTLGAMVCIANTFGAGSMKASFLKPAILMAKATAEISHELAIAKWMIDKYTRKERKKHPDVAIVVDRGFLANPGELPSESLGHRGARAHSLVLEFSAGKGEIFTELGTFTLGRDESFPHDAATA
jgi:hypothetical protein